MGRGYQFRSGDKIRGKPQEGPLSREPLRLLWHICGLFVSKNSQYKDDKPWIWCVVPFTGTGMGVVVVEEWVKIMTASTC